MEEDRRVVVPICGWRQFFFIFYMQNFYFYFWRKKNSNTLYNLNVGVRIGTYCGSHLLAEDAGRNVVVVGCRMLLGWWCDDEKWEKKTERSSNVGRAPDAGANGGGLNNGSVASVGRPRPRLKATALRRPASSISRPTSKHPSIPAHSEFEAWRLNISKSCNKRGKLF